MKEKALTQSREAAEIRKEKKMIGRKMTDRKMRQRPTSVFHAVSNPFRTGLSQATPTAAGWAIEIRKESTCTELKIDLRWFILFPTERAEIAEVEVGSAWPALYS